MSVQTQIDRLTKAKSDLKASITGKGVAVSDDALLSDYPALVDSIQTGSDLKVQDSKAVSYTANGSYDVSPDSGYDGMVKVTVDVNVPEKTFRTQEKTATENGAVVPDNGYDGLSKVTVNVPIKNVEASKTVTYTENGDYTISPDSGYDGIAGASVKVNVTSTIPVQTVDLDTGISFGKSKFTTLPFTVTGGGNRTDMSYMFNGCSSLTSLDLSGLNTSQVTNMAWMFKDCSSLETLDLSSFDTSNVSGMTRMFSNCSSLETLDLSSFDTSKVTYMNFMFDSCRSLTTVKVINCNDATKQKILTQLQKDLSSKTWTLGDDGIITGVAK